MLVKCEIELNVQFFLSHCHSNVDFIQLENRFKTFTRTEIDDICSESFVEHGHCLILVLFFFHF